MGELALVAGWKQGFLFSTYEEPHASAQSGGSEPVDARHVRPDRTRTAGHCGGEEIGICGSTGQSVPGSGSWLRVEVGGGKGPGTSRQFNVPKYKVGVGRFGIGDRNNWSETTG